MFIWCLSTYGEGGIWTLAPLLTTCTLSRGVPSTTWVLLQKVDSKYYLAHQRRRNISNGEGGIRTHAPLRTNGFQDRLVMTTSIPLRITACSATLIIIANKSFIVNTFLNNFFNIFFSLKSPVFTCFVARCQLIFLIIFSNYTPKKIEISELCKLFKHFNLSFYTLLTSIILSFLQSSYLPEWLFSYSHKKPLPILPFCL